jgi:hypothetical protein
VWCTQGSAHHSCVVDGGATKFNAWFAHAEPGGHQTDAEEVWYITSLDVAFDATASGPSAAWTSSERLASPAATLNRDVAARFAK